MQQQGLLNTKNLIGQKFGKLTVIERIPGLNGTRGKWKCSCECGGETITDSNKLLSGHSQSCGCLQSSGEMKIANFLTENNLLFKKEYSFNDLKRKNVLRFDFALFDKNNKLLALIEYDGIQHFNKNNIFYNEEIIENDNSKNEYCLLNNIILFRIKYNEDIEERMREIICKVYKQDMES